MTRVAILAAIILAAIAILARRSPDLSDHHVHVVPGTRCAICEWDDIERRMG